MTALDCWRFSRLRERERRKAGSASEISSSRGL